MGKKARKDKRWQNYECREEKTDGKVVQELATHIELILGPEVEEVFGLPHYFTHSGSSIYKYSKSHTDAKVPLCLGLVQIEVVTPKHTGGQKKSSAVRT